MITFTVYTKIRIFKELTVMADICTMWAGNGIATNSVAMDIMTFEIGERVKD